MQKYNCHKVNEFVVGTSSVKEGDINTFSVQLLQTMSDMSQPVTQDVRKRVNFYRELLQEQARSGQDLRYWLDYVTMFGTEHLVPAYDGMSLLAYFNAQVWILAFLFLLGLYVAVSTTLDVFYSILGLNKKDSAKAQDVKEKKD